MFESSQCFVVMVVVVEARVGCELARDRIANYQSGHRQRGAAERQLVGSVGWLIEMGKDRG